MKSNQLMKDVQSRIDRIIIVIGLVWSIIVAALLVWHYAETQSSFTAIARAGLLEAFNKDLVYRRWAASHGGVYVPATPLTPPNPYLAHVPDRDITTASGKLLTLMNPAYMTRQVQELGEKDFGYKGRITSLKPLRPENSPDGWEQQALLQFEQGKKEVWSFEPIEGETYLRFMSPFVVEEGCLKCHADQNHKVGDIRGGISLSTPWSPFQEKISPQLHAQVLTYSGIWLLGLGGLLASRRSIRNSLSERGLKEEQLKSSEARYRALCEHMSSAVAVYRAENEGKDFFFLDFNEAGEKIEQINRRDVIGRNVLDVFPGVSEFGLLEVLQRVWRTGIAENYPARRYKDFRIEGWRDNFVYKLPSGELVAVYTDETERKKAEEDLCFQKERFQALTENYPFAMVIVQPDGTFTYANPKFTEIFGYDLTDVPRGREWLRKAYPDKDYRKFVISAWIEDVTDHAPGETRPRIFSVTCKDGNPKTIQFRPVKLTSGEDLMTCEDITERKHAADALAESEEKYRSLFEDSIDAIFIAATDGTLIDANKAFLELLKFKRQNIIGLKVFQVYVDVSDRRALIEELDNRGSVKDYPVSLKRDDGRIVDCLVSAVVRKDAYGTIIGYRGMIRDITEFRSLQRQLLQAQKMEAIGTLAGGIAHDFNNLLQAVLGYTQLMLQRKHPDDRDYTDLQKIQQAGKRGSDLVQSLLTFGRKVEPKRRPINLNHEILQIQSLLSRTIPKTINIDLHLNGSLEQVLADPSQFAQILMNLGVNARDAMPDGGTLTLKTENSVLDNRYSAAHPGLEAGQYVLLTVSDTGQGMTKETLAHIFEPFFSTKEVGKGTGLGLATVHGIVTQHDGHITCSSEPGVGTTFTIYLPAIQTEQESEIVTELAPIQGGDETILMVDDEEVLRQLATLVLSQFGYEVMTAANGREAMEIWAREGRRISLVILDLSMPEMDGKQCLAEILRIDPNAKVLIASGYSENGPIPETALSGARGFIEKPYDMAELLQRVREVLDADR